MIMEGPDSGSDFPAGLADRGSRLWREANEAWQLTPAHLVLLEEACRITDRLDVLNTIILRGSADVKSNDGELPDIQGVLAETRQQQGALRMLIAEIRQGQTGFAPVVPSSEQEATGVSDLTARIAKKKAQG
ncbi:hypothetical protein LXH13_06195 [Streptomyces spinosirectus]|jgi:hypothetical protein|uniref:hypothetical protein n=2 Tax=Streptomyces TaxID=1883 RepID=UPI001F391520|nr:hypothetical protein [Streptomyces spinosirectus]MBY8342004.1 hypothetical protein [Streptomyces plumbidurans]UIR16649.1 hypothetical protein LXH13_06195 [Streptomyces spinosirectus]